MLVSATSRSCARWPAAERLVQLAGLGVDEVRRELAGAAPEQHVGQRHVAPEEPGQVQPDEQHDQRVEDLRQAVVRAGRG